MISERFDAFIHEKKGVFLDGDYNIHLTDIGESVSIREIKQRARELGYINGYRWGVEYPTYGKKPDLADDIFVQMKYPNGEWHPLVGGGLGYFTHSAFSSFRITDQRYKPADTSYLENNNLAQVDDTDVVESEWYDYDNQEAIGLPPVGEILEFVESSKFEKTRSEWVTGQKVKIISHEVVNGNSVAVVFNIDAEFAECLVYQCMRPLDHNRKAEAEKKRVVDAALSVWVKRDNAPDALLALYDAGYLKLPAE